MSSIARITDLQPKGIFFLVSPSDIKTSLIRQKFQKLKRVCCRTSGTGVAYCVWRNKTFVDTALVALIVSHHPVKFVSVVNEEESFKALKRLEVFPERDRKTEISQIDINKSIPDRVMSPYQLRSIIFNVVFTFLSSSEV